MNFSRNGADIKLHRQVAKRLMMMLHSRNIWPYVELCAYSHDKALRMAKIGGNILQIHKKSGHFDHNGMPY